jgi:hypothetical protein
MGVSEVPPNHDIVAAMCSLAVMDERKDVTEISTCEVESEQQIVTTKEDLSAYKIMCNM